MLTSGITYKDLRIFAAPFVDVTSHNIKMRRNICGIKE
jgi:hypothetical protein